uniref:NEPH-1 n=1 Tax=Schmidtea mediterranea TaxID=79327 RepID=A0A0H3YJP5_SCHMD|nr:NEPH-1 [Schmidtea mediterranea]
MLIVHGAFHIPGNLAFTSLYIYLWMVKFADNQILGPVSTSVLINSTARLRCRVTFNNSNTPVKVQWQKDGFGYENETLRDHFNGRYQMPGPRETGTYDLVIHSVDKQDDGEYACQVNAAIHILETTKSINLTVIVPPDKIKLKSSQFDFQNNSTNNEIIQNIWGHLNEFLILSCEIQYSRPATELVWKLGEFALREGKSGDIDGQEVGTVTTKSEFMDSFDQFYYKSESHLRLRLRKDHNGEILKCTIANEQSFMHKTPKPAIMKLNVLFVLDVKMDVIPHRPFFHFTEHEMIQINCSASTNPANVIYNWIKYNPTTKTTTIIKYFDRSGVLKIKVRRDLNNMFIRCQVLSVLAGKECYSNFQAESIIYDNSYLVNCSERHTANGSSQIILRVQYSPIILDSILETKAAFLGDVVTLDCRADSNPPAKITWYKSKFSSKEIMANPDLVGARNLQKDTQMSSYSSMTLLSISDKYHFTITDADNLGLFICIALTDGFPPVQKTVFVGQGATPQIVNNQKIIIAKSGLSVRISCHIISIPLPDKGKIIWFKNLNTKPIEAKSKNQIYEEERLAGVVSYLYIHKVTYEDYGTYNCSVSNPYGRVSSTIELIPPVETPMIFIIGSSCAIALAVLFAFIIFCIIRTSKNRSTSTNQRSVYMKGHMMSPCHSPLSQENFGTGFTNAYIDGVGDFGNMDFMQMSSKNNYESTCASGPQSMINNISGIYLDSNLNYYQTNTKDMKVIPEMDQIHNHNIYQRRSEWMENHNSQIEGANESTRSYDSGVCPDESILTSCSPYHPNQSTNFGVPSCQIIPLYQSSKTDQELSQSSQNIYYPALNVSKNILSSVSLASVLYHKPIISCSNRNDYNYQFPTIKDSFIVPNIQSEVQPFDQEQYRTINNLPDLTDVREPVLPYIIAYSPTCITRKNLDWTSLNQSTKL